MTNSNTADYYTNISKVQETDTIKLFKSILEIYSGIKYVLSVTVLLDTVITNNKTNEEHIITVIYKKLLQKKQIVL